MSPVSTIDAAAEVDAIVKRANLSGYHRIGKMIGLNEHDIWAAIRWRLLEHHNKSWPRPIWDYEAVSDEIKRRYPTQQEMAREFGYERETATAGLHRTRNLRGSSSRAVVLLSRLVRRSA